MLQEKFMVVADVHGGRGSFTFMSVNALVEVSHSCDGSDKIPQTYEQTYGLSVVNSHPYLLPPLLT